jgi:hypothetical protein
MTNVSNEDFVDQITYDSDRVSRFRRRLIKVEERLTSIEQRLDIQKPIGDTAMYRKGYADAVQEVINHVKNFGE